MFALALCYPPRSVQIQSISASSLAYAEVLIAEIALRNRERIMLVLPLLLEHYRRVGIVVVLRPWLCRGFYLLLAYCMFPRVKETKAWVDDSLGPDGEEFVQAT